MKRYILIIMGSLLPYFLVAQQAFLTLDVKVVDQHSQAILPFATANVFELNNDSVPIATVLSNAQGILSLKLKAGNYRIAVKLLGYLDGNQQIALTASTAQLVLALVPASKTLKEVSITGAKKTIEITANGYRFNVDKALGATGPIFEVLRQVPGVTVDGANHIRLQGKNIAVLVNGRKVNMGGDELAAYLKSIPASKVAKIEVNTSPNAKFDADGEGGLLDIQLKAGPAPGFFGNLSSNVSTLLSSDHNASLNFRKNRWDVSANYGYSYREGYYKRNNSYENRNLPDSLFRFVQTQRADQVQNSHYLKTGLAHQADSTALVGFNFFGAWFRQKAPTTLNTNIFNSEQLFQNRYQQNESNHTHNSFYIYDLFYKKTFAKNKLLNLGLNYASYQNQLDQVFNRTFYGANGTPIADEYATNRKIGTTRPYELLTANSDFELSLNASNKLEIGAKYLYANTSSRFENQVNDGQGYRTDPSLSNQLNYRESTLAAYGLWSGKLKKISFQAGLRLEDFRYHLNSDALATSYHNSYLSLFPSFNLSYAHQRSTFTLSANRRIQRPGYAMLNPFLNVLSLGQYHVGNPYLKPYFANKAELRFSRTYGAGNFIMVALFASEAQNIYSQVLQYSPAQQMNVDTYDNFRGTTQVGSYLVVQHTLAKWLNFNAYLAGTQAHFSSKIPDDVFNADNFSVTSNLSLNFNFIKNTPVQLYGYFVSRSRYFQLDNGSNGNISLAMQRQLLKNKLTVSLNMEDLFNLNRYPVTVNTPNVYIHSLNKMQSQYLRLGLAFNFGKNFGSKSAKDLKKDSRID